MTTHIDLAELKLWELYERAKKCNENAKKCYENAKKKLRMRKQNLRKSKTVELVKSENIYLYNILKSCNNSNLIN